MHRTLLNKILFPALLACCVAVTAWAEEDVDDVKAVPVTVKALKDVEVHVIRDAPATVVSLNDTRISAEIAGRLEDLAVRVGDKVAKGDVLATLDCRDYEIQLKKAKAALQAAQAKNRFDKQRLKKARKLSSKKSIAAEELDRRISNASISNAEVDRLKAELNAAKRSEGKCVLHAPFNAVVIQRLASIGDFLSQGTPVLRLLDQESIEISAKVQEQDLDTLRKSKQFEFVSRRKHYAVSLRAILPLIESKGRSYEVRFSFLGDRSSPGATGRVEWSLGKGWMPSELLVRRDSGMGLFVLRDGHASFVPIEDAKEGQAAKVDMPPETQIIVDGRFAVSDKDPVQVAQP